MRFLFSFVALLLLFSCGDGATPGSRLLTLDGGAPAINERIRDRMAIRATVHHLDSEGATISRSERAYDDTNKVDFLALLDRTNLCDYSGSPTLPCERELGFEVRSRICRAHAMMEIAGIVSEPLVREESLARTVFPRQSPESQARLAMWAQEEVRDAALWSLHALESLAGDVTTFPENFDVYPSCDATNAGNPAADEQGASNAEALALYLVEAVDLAQETALRTVELDLAASDSFYSSIPDARQASEQAISGAYLSRTHAAHVLVGGDPGLFSPLTRDVSYDRAFCTLPELSSGARAAIDVLRESGIPPTMITDSSVLTAELLVSQAIPGGCVAQRLDDFWGPAEEWPDTIGVAEFSDSLGLTLEAFQEAREYLAQEIHAFGRSVTYFLPPERLPSGMSTYVRYVGTATRPSSPPRAYYTSIAQASTEARIDARAELPQALPDGSRGASYLLSFVRNRLSVILPRFDGLGFDLDVVAPLSALVASLDRSVVGLVAQRVFQDGSIKDLAFFGSTALDGASVVTSLDAARCASEGHVEGAPCTVDDLAGRLEAGPAVVVSPTDTTFGYTSVQQFESFSAPAGYYLLALRPGAEPKLPGSYRIVMGSFPQGFEGLPEEMRTTVIPIHPEFDEQVAGLLEPSESWCSHPQLTCAGVRYDSRIPLENELSDDGDPIETSWRHYLALARQAADEADFLGQRVIESGLALDLRAEAAVEDLEALCGSSLSVDRLFAEDGSDLLGDECQTGCAADEVCVGSRCVRDPIAYAQSNASRDSNAQRLDACAGDDSIEPLVALGDRPLCVWRNQNALCGVPDGYPGPIPSCPALPDSTGGCPEDPPPTGEWEVVEETLDYFATDALTPFALGNPPCDALRELRAQGFTAEAWESIVRSGFFDPTRLRGVAQALSWEAQPYDFSAVSLNGKVWISTGDLSLDQSAWPCDGGLQGAAPLPEGCGSTAEGLFCARASCDDRMQRAQFNQRLARAVVGARLLTDTGLEGIRLPYWRSDQAFLPEELRDVHEISARGRVLREGQGVRRRLQGARSYCVACPGCSDVDAILWTGVSEAPVDGVARCGEGALTIFDAGLTYNAMRDAPFDPNADIGVRYAGALFSGLGLTPPREEMIGSVRVGSWVRRLFTSASEASVPALPLSVDYSSVDAVFEANRFFEDDYGHTVEDLSRAYRQATAIVEGAQPTLRALTSLSSVRDGSYGMQMPNELNPFCSHRFFGLTVEPPTDYDDGIVAQEQCGWSPSSEELFDSLELMCEATRNEIVPCNTSAPPRVDGPQDLGRVRDFLSCVANNIENRAAWSLVANVPRNALGALRMQSGAGCYPEVGGEYGEGVCRLRSSLQQLSTSSTLLSSEIAHMSEDVEQVRLAYAAAEIQADISEVRFLANVSERLAQCAIAASDIDLFKMTGGFQAAATCANSLAQISFASQISASEGELYENSTQVAVSRFRDSFATRSANLRSISTDIGSALEEIDARLAALETIRVRARRAVGRAAFLDTDEMMGAHYAANAVMRRRHNANRVRYERSRRDALEMTYLARRAVEQRLGMTLSSMNEPLSLVAAPSTWEADVCMLDGVDYGRIRDTVNLAGRDDGEDDYAGEFVGRYVDRLEQVVESYRLDYPFQQGTDRAILSLRDDVLRARSECDVESRNLLVQAGQLDASEVWTAEGCRIDGATGEALPNCVGIGALGQGDVEPPLGAVPGHQIASMQTTPFFEGSAFDTGVEEVSAARGYRITFGGYSGGGCTPDAPECGLTRDTALVQKVALGEGRYRLSWYAAAAGYVSEGGSWVPVAGPSGDKAVGIESEAGAELGGVVSEQSASGSRWRRYWRDIELDDGQLVSVVVRPAESLFPQQVDLAGVMLEVLEEGPGGQIATAPGAFSNTTNERRVSLAMCEDSDGTEFRSQWSYRCIPLCEGGLSRCDRGALANYCFWETEVTVSQRDIEMGRQLTRSGFARGNFNYRVDTIGLNFVGDVRDCSESSSPSTCYSSGYVPYSIEHIGPYTVRNHRGEDYDAPLFTGRIEHARGLAAERYLTNPLSSTDRALIEPYMRRELRGRPLDGTYVIRVWDEEGFNFHGIEDVQVVLNYAYWTRTD